MDRAAGRYEVSLAGLRRHPPSVVDSTIDLTRPGSCKKLVKTIQEVEAHFDIKIGLLIIDTFAKLIASSGGDESTARDQGAVFANVYELRTRPTPMSP